MEFTDSSFNKLNENGDEILIDTRSVEYIKKV